MSVNQIKRLVDEAVPLRRAGTETSTVIDGLTFDPCTHLANAYRLVAHFGEEMLFVRGIGWHIWGPPWRFNDLGAKLIAQKLGKIIGREASDMAPWVAAATSKAERAGRESEMARRRKWAISSENASTLEASLRMAAPILLCQAKDLDNSPFLLGLPSGVLDLDTGIHRKHRPADRLTKIAGCDFNPEALAPTWDRFLNEIMNNDSDLIDFLQRLAGYSLSGARDLQILPIAWGGGANGKSTLLGALQRMLGDYSGVAAPGLLIKRFGSDHPTGIASLQGRRLVIVSETGESGRLNEEQVKFLTGGDKINARRMREDFFEFDPTHLFLLQTNHRPRVTGADDGIWRRLRLIPFTVTVPEDRRDTQLSNKLSAELPGILAWCWRGWQKYRADGLNDPPAVRVATSEYRNSSDQIGEFLSECCDLGPHLTAPVAVIYNAYVRWADEAGEHARSKRDFGTRLGERGYKHYRTSSERRWGGLRVRE